MDRYVLLKFFLPYINCHCVMLLDVQLHKDKDEEKGTSLNSFLLLSTYKSNEQISYSSRYGFNKPSFQAWQPVWEKDNFEFKNRVEGNENPVGYLSLEVMVIHGY